MKRESRNLHDAMVARLASSTLRNRFNVDFNEAARFQGRTNHSEISSAVEPDR